MNSEREKHRVATAENKKPVLDVVNDTSESSIHSSEDEAKLTELAEMYKKADQSVLLSFDVNGKETFKKLGEVIKEIEAVLLQQKDLNEKEVNNYMNGVISRLRSEIQLTSQNIASEKSDEQRRLSLIQVRNKKYEELLESVAAFMETGKINKEQEPIVEERETSAEVLELFDEKLNVLKNKFVTYKALLKEKGGVIKTSPACIGAQNIINNINNLKEPDITIRRNIEKTYLRNLDRALNNLGGEITLLAINSIANKKVEDQSNVLTSDEIESEILNEDVNSSDNKLVSEIDTGLLAEDVASQSKVDNIGITTISSVEDSVSQPEENNAGIEGLMRRRQVDENGNTRQNESTFDVNNSVKESINNKKERAEWSKARAIFKQNEQKYNDALASYYKEYHDHDSWRSKINRTIDGAKNIFGINPELPLSLRLMREDYKFTRANYLASLDAALTQRALIAGNKEYDLNKDETKIAFGQKFIIKPNQERLDLQAKNALSLSEQSRLNSVMATLSKYKWHNRVGSVALAGVLGAASGGVGALAVGASWQAWKIAASSVAGAAAGKFIKRATQVRVDAAVNTLKTATENSAQNFSLEELNNLENDLLLAYSAKDTAEKRQRAATVASTVATGFATGATLHSFDSDVVELEKADSVIEKKVSPIKFAVNDYSHVALNDTAKVSESAPVFTEVSENSVQETVEKNVHSSAVDNLPKVWQLNPEIEVNYYDANGTPTNSLILSDIKLTGNFNISPISDSVLEKVSESIALSTKDLLEAHPNMSETVLENKILEKLESDFGDEDWWQSSITPDTKIDIGEIKQVPAENVISADTSPVQNSNPETVEELPVVDIPKVETYSTPELAPEVVEEIQSENPAEVLNDSAEIIPIHPYLVERVEDLRDIILEEFDKDLAGLSLNQQNEIVDKVMAIARTDEEVRSSLGLRSNDPELVYAGERIDLGRVGVELERLIKLQDGDYVPYAKTAGLNILPDNDVHEIPIKVEVPAADITPVQTEITPVMEQATPSPETIVQEIINPPRPFSLTGNYANTPEYSQYIEHKFGDLKTFEKIIDRSITNFDNNTYSILDRSVFFGNDYQSPYHLMQDMTLSEIREFSNQTPAEIKNILTAENIKYETYLAWKDEIDKMQNQLPHESSTKLSDLYTRYVAEQPINNLDILNKRK